MSEQARYEVRTPMALWLTNGVVAALCVLIAGGFLMFGGRVPGMLIMLLSILATTAVTFWFSMSAYRVGGGRNLIRFYADRIEVPSTTRRQPLVFHRDGLDLKITDVMVRYRLGFAATLGTVRRGALIAFKRNGVTRQLSTLTLAAEGGRGAAARGPAQLHRRHGRGRPRGTQRPAAPHELR